MLEKRYSERGAETFHKKSQKKAIFLHIGNNDQNKKSALKRFSTKFCQKAQNNFLIKNLANAFSQEN